MIVKEYGNKELPKIILFHPMLANGSSCMNLLQSLGNEYHFIVPDFSSHGKDDSMFLTAELEANEFVQYLRTNNYSEVELLFGASMGAVVALHILKVDDIFFKTIVLDGAPLYRNANLLFHCLMCMMLSKQKKIKEQPKRGIQKLQELYGELAESMADSLSRMSRESLHNILWSCTHFDFPQYQKSLQKRMFFEFGSKDFYAKRAKFIQERYPWVHVNIRKGYGHCDFLVRNSLAYTDMLNKYMNLIPFS